ncbi:unnamed protein product [Dracunculus medinensis]|uniref:HCO3_cotransp domain-containing protein n=1 Tax=Dracunculus medinensis TaxID=318479 RepID=A0A0N4UGI4_DRAME|nr:unnamed protein product [Dracunculus medinensis]
MDFVPNEIKEVAISIDSNLKMADSIRRRRLEQRDYGGRGLDDSLITSEDLMATEPDFDAAVIGAHLPHIYRLGSLKESNDNDDGNDDEHKLLLQHEKVSVDHSLSWFKRTKKSLHGDFTSICLLLFLYLLQGIPLGLIAAIPLVLSSRNVSFAQQAVFSFAYWPFR